MKKENEVTCDTEMDYIHHMLNEEITRICVEEEEERMKEEQIEHQ